MIKSKAIFLTVLMLAAFLAGCVSQTTPEAATMAAAAEKPTPTAISSPAPCDLPPVLVPTPPATIPGYAQLDETTNLHVTGKAPEIELASWRLEVTGKVDRPLSLTYDELRCLPKVELRCTLVCPGFFEDEATWAGVPLYVVLEMAGLQPGATGIKLYAADGYATVVYMDAAREKGNFIAYEWEGEPLPILHGFPVRMVFPALDGNRWVKWLVKIEVL